MEPPVHGVAASSPIRRHHSLRSPPPERYLSFSYSPTSSTGDELTEDDIFDTATEPPSPQSSSNPNPNHHHQPRHQHTNLGILAALPASQTRSVFNHKASASSAASATASVSSSSSSSSSSTSSSSRMIPAVHRRPPVVEQRRNFFHQSAPVNVPVLSAAVEEERRRRRGVDYVTEVDEDEDGVEVQMLPPHEMVAARDSAVSCSVLEGVGRTLKGRDLRRVRNAVFRKTGFLD